MLRNGQEKSKISFVYFTCNKHFKYLFLSLKSLQKVSSTITGNVYLFIDKNDFLSDKHLDMLKKIRLECKVRKCEEITWAGEQLVMSEFSAFKEIYKELNTNDYVAKVDSDVLFISDSIFRDVLKSNADVMGKEETHWSPLTYIQGGCYFLRVSFIPELVNFNKDIFTTILHKINTHIAETTGLPACASCPEDAAVYFIAKTKTDKIIFKDFYGSSIARAGNNVSIIHFQNVKGLMNLYFRYGYRASLFKLMLLNFYYRCRSFWREL